MASKASPSRRPRVLIVEPERDVRETLGEILVGWGYGPVGAANGREALRLARARRPWVVLSELHLEDLDPAELLARLRTSGPERRPACIALTSWCRLEDRLRAGRAGFDRVLFKPTDLDELHGLLESLTSSRRPLPRRPAAAWSGRHAVPSTNA